MREPSKARIHSAGWLAPISSSPPIASESCKITAKSPVAMHALQLSKLFNVAENLPISRLNRPPVFHLPSQSKQISRFGNLKLRSMANIAESLNKVHSMH